MAIVGLLMYQIMADAILQQVKLMQKEIVLTIMVDLAKRKQGLSYMGSPLFLCYNTYRLPVTNPALFTTPQLV
ncbi:hypothetical protein JPSP2_19360 [Staphylococcus pseudintermedius]